MFPIFDPIFKRLGSVGVVATMSPGNVHTALKHQAPFRLLIPLEHSESDSKTETRDPMYPTEKKYSFSARQVLVVGDSLCLVVWTQPLHWRSGIWVLWDRLNTSYM